MTRLSHILTGFMAAVLILTGGAMASARGQAMAVGEMVICTGTGPVTVPVDADGAPTGPPHICPDCALSLIAMDAPAPVVLPVRVAAGQAISWPVRTVIAPSRNRTVPMARGPPAV